MKGLRQGGNGVQKPGRLEPRFLSLLGGIDLCNSPAMRSTASQSSTELMEWMAVHSGSTLRTLLR